MSVLLWMRVKERLRRPGRYTPSRVGVALALAAVAVMFAAFLLLLESCF